MELAGASRGEVMIWKLLKSFKRESPRTALSLEPAHAFRRVAMIWNLHALVGLLRDPERPKGNLGSEPGKVPPGWFGKPCIILF